MAKAKKTDEHKKAAYVASYRRKQRRAGLRRLEVAVKSKDAPLVKRLAHVLCEDGPNAHALREKLLRGDAANKPKTGADLLALLRRGALFEDDFIIERDKTISVPAEFD